MEMKRSRKGRFCTAKRAQKHESQSERMKVCNPMIEMEIDNSCVETESERATSVDTSDSQNVLSGRRIVELGHLAKQMKCVKCSDNLKLSDTVDDKRFGYGSILNIKCQCGELNKVETSKRHRPEGSSRGPPVFDINTKAAIGMYHSGSGHTQISNFMSAIEVQGLHHKSMKKRESEVQRHIANIADQSCIESLEEEISLQKEKNGSDNDEVSVEMKYDMAWQKRGSGRCYDSKSGVGTVIGNNTGKICGYGVRSSSCKTCSLHINKGKTPPEHTCFKNWNGSAKSMEPDVAAESIKKIETTPNVKVGTLIMDDDTTTISRIRQTVSHPVTKWSDMNHTRKHVGNNLYKLQKKHKCLTTKVIQYLQKCLTYAISQNKNNADGLSKALKGIVPHVFGQHESCDKQWCGFHANPDTYKHKSLPYGKDLSGDELCKDLNNVFDNLVMNVEKIAPAASTRDVESFNNMIASKAPKRCHYSGSGSLNNRVNCAVAQKNIGSSYVARVNSSLGISPGKFYAQHADRKDNIRKRHLIYESTKDFKKRKIEKKINKSVKNSQVELREGATYKTCVDLNDESTHDIEEIPSPVFPPANVKIQEFDSSLVYCDIETTDLSKTCDITQLSAVCDKDIFNVYILPTKPISRFASHVTGLEYHGNSLFYNGKQVHAISLKEALTLFLAWLHDRKPCTLIGHNFKLFDFPRIIRAFELCNLLSAFQNVVHGIVDTLPLFRQVYPNLEKFNQEFLVSHVLNESYSAHNAEADVCSLQKLVLASNCQRFLNDHSSTTGSCIELYHFEKFYEANYITLFSMQQQKVISKPMALKISKSGLQLGHLKLSIERDGYEGLKKLFSERVCGKPRVTVAKRIVDSVYNYLYPPLSR